MPESLPLRIGCVVAPGLCRCPAEHSHTFGPDLCDRCPERRKHSTGCAVHAGKDCNCCPLPGGTCPRRVPA